MLKPTEDLDLKLRKDHWKERTELAAAFRWVARLGMNEAVGNHLSLSISNDGKKFLLNPRLMHFSLIRASDLIVIDSDQPATFSRVGAPDPSAWGLHGSVHRRCPHHRCCMHVHSTYSTILACLADSRLPPIDQNSAAFFNRIIYDEHYDGLAFKNEGERCANLLTDPNKKILVMGNHGILVMGESVADTFNRLYYFERAAKNYINALQTGKKLRLMSEKTASRVALETENYDGFAEQHLLNLMKILDNEGSDYAS